MDRLRQQFRNHHAAISVAKTIAPIRSPRRTDRFDHFACVIGSRRKRADALFEWSGSWLKVFVCMNTKILSTERSEVGRVCRRATGAKPIDQQRSCSHGFKRASSGKVVIAWAFEGDCSPSDLVSNTCEVEWPPRSNERIIIPEVDRGAWFPLPEAASYIREEQRGFLSRLEHQLR